MFFLSEIITYELVALRREYLSSEANVLTNSLKIVHITNRDFFRLNYLPSF